VQKPDCDLLMKAYSVGNAPWESDDYMLPVISDDTLLQFGKVFMSAYNVGIAQGFRILETECREHFLGDFCCSCPCIFSANCIKLSL